MNNENYHSTLQVPPIAHALDKWDESNGELTYEYNGRNILKIYIPGENEIGFRHGSDGNIQSIPFIQQIYLMNEGSDEFIKSKVKITLSKSALIMRPNRASDEEAILGQIGNPLIHGVNGVYDIEQDLLIDWHGVKWYWDAEEFEKNEDGDMTAEFYVEIGPKPMTINLRMQYYRKHLGYEYHKPWERKPNPKSVSGWCSWEACRRLVSMEDIKDISDFFGDSLKDYGLEYIQLDDGYEKLPIPFDSEKNLVSGWTETNERFPGGHKEVVKYIKDKGLSPAIWTNANVTNKKFAEMNSECFIKDSNDELMLGEWIDYLLDCSDETLLVHVYPYYKELREMGYKYFKTDAIRHLLLDGLHEAVRQGILSNEEAQIRFRRFMEYARNGIGNDNYFLASWGVLSEVVGLVDSCRIAMDANPTWAGIRMQLVESARWFHTQRILFTNDPDHICARTNIEWLKSIISLTSLSGSLLMLSDPIHNYDDKRMDIIKKNLPPLKTYTAETGTIDMTYPAFTWTKLHGFAVNSKEKPVEAEEVSIDDALNMAGEYTTMMNDHPLSTLWSFHINKSWKNWCVIGRFATVPLKASDVYLESLGLKPYKEYLAFDFWEQKYLGRVKEKMRFDELQLGACQIVSLTEIKDTPQFIASSRHVSMDAISVKQQFWMKGKKQLHVIINGVVGSKETYWFYVPKNYRFVGINNQKAIIPFVMDEILKIDIEFVEEEMICIINFDKV